MEIIKNSVDDILLALLPKVLKDGCYVESSKGKNKEILGVHIILQNPLNRISKSLARNLFISPLGEFFWYLSGSNKLEDIKFFISKYERYSNDGVILNGAYGKRMFEGEDHNQINKVIRLLERKTHTRQAVIQLFKSSDLDDESNRDVPCTCTIQLIQRNGKLDMFVNMRSNDLFVGFPHDVFCFTMLQEMIANKLELDLGKYHHFVSSLHIYENDFHKVEKYCSEGYHSTKYVMPKMPPKSFEKINQILKIANKIKNEEIVDFEGFKMDDYWKDLLIILQIYSSNKSSNKLEIRRLFNLMNIEFFKDYIQNKYNLDEE